jgi:hypothetical protein
MAAALAVLVLFPLTAHAQTFPPASPTVDDPRSVRCYEAGWLPGQVFNQRSPIPPPSPSPDEVACPLGFYPIAEKAIGWGSDRTPWWQAQVTPGQDYAYTIGDHDTSKIEFFVGERLLHHANCPDPPCHDFLRVPRGAAGSTLRVVFTDADGLTRELLLPIVGDGEH